MVKDPHSPSVLRVQRVIEGEVKEFMVQEDVEYAIQQECKVRFSLAHSAPIMNMLLGEKLRYLSGDHYRDIQYPTRPGPHHGNDSEGDRCIGDEDSQRQHKQNHNNAGGLQALLEEGKQIHVIVDVWRDYGHYKTTTQDLLSTEVLAMQLTVIARSGIPPDS